MAHEKSKEQQNIDETAYLEECRARRQRLSRYRVAASNTAGLLSVGVLGLELSRKLGYGNVCSNECKAMILVPAFGLLATVVPVEQGKGVSAISFLALYMAWIAALVKKEWFSPTLLMGIGSVSFSLLGWEVWTGNHGSE